MESKLNHKNKKVFCIRRSTVGGAGLMQKTCGAGLRPQQSSPVETKKERPDVLVFRVEVGLDVSLERPCLDRELDRPVVLTVSGELLVAENVGHVAAVVAVLRNVGIRRTQHDESPVGCL